MSNIIPFEYNSRQVRTVVKDGEPWFVAADVCSILDIDTSTAVNGRNRIRPKNPLTSVMGSVK